MSNAVSPVREAAMSSYQPQQEHQYGTQGKKPGQTAFGTGHWSGVFFAILEHGVINVFLEVRLVVAAAYHQHVIGINHQEV